MIKRKFSLILVLLLLLNLVTGVTFGDEKLNIKVETIIGLGIFNGDNEGNLNLDKNVTRGEFAKILYTVLEFGNDTPPSANLKLYDDVDVWDWNAGYITYLSEIGVINGVGDGKFAPNDEVTFAQVYKMLLKCAGYEEYVNAKYDTYPQNYMMMAGETGLSNGVGGSADMAVNRKSAAEILYNLLSVDVIYTTGSGYKGVTLNTKGKFCEEVMDLYKVQGIIQGDEVLSITGEAENKGYVRVNNNRYFTDGVMYTDLVGSYVAMYYTKLEADGTGKVIYINEDVKKNAVTVLSDSDGVSYSGGFYRYDGNNRNEKVAIGKNVIVLYNYSVTGNEKLYAPKNGTVKLISNDGDSDIDVAIVYDYETFEVERIDDGEMKIIATTYEIAFQNRLLYDFYSPDNSKMNFSGVAVGNVISVLQNKDVPYGYVRLMVSDKKVTGVIDEIAEYGGYNEVIVNGEKFKLLPDKDLYTKANNCLGQSVTLKLDFSGKVAAIDYFDKNAESESYRMGYVISVHMTNGIQDKVKFKILDQDGSISIMSADKIKFNGAKISNNDLYANFYYIDKSATKRQPIRYKRLFNEINENKINKNEIKEIQTGKLYAVGQPDDNSLLLTASGNFFYKTTPKIFKRLWQGSPDGEIIAADNAVVFDVPPPESTKEYEDDAYKVIGVDAIASEDEICRADGYNVDPKALDHSLIIVYRGGSEAFTKDQNVSIVTNITTVYDEKLNMESKKITVLSRGEEKSYIANEDGVFTVSGGYNITKGDIIRVLTNKYGYATKCELLYSKNTENSMFASNPILGNPDSSTNSPCRMIFGFAQKIYGGNISFRFEDGSIPTEYFKIGDAPVYLYDENSKEKVKIKRGSVDNILEYDYSPNSRVILQLANANVVQVIFIK